MNGKYGNNQAKNQQKQDKQLEKICDMYIEILPKLFIERKDEKQRYIYNRKIEKKLQKDKKHAYLVSRLSDFEKIKLAFNESIMDVPFRMGHTVIGVPFQVALGIAAGAFGFFHSSLFIMVEGMAETLLGSITTFVYSYITRFKRNARLHHTEF